MTETDGSATFDHSSHPSFSAYYAAQSISPRTRERFTRIREKVLRLVHAQRTGADRLTVLDIGCGAGAQAWLWAELGHAVHGIDVNGDLIEVARERARRDQLRDVHFEVGSATQLPFADASMDVCLMPELLEHVDDWQSCVREAVRVLRPGGVLYLSTTNALCPRQSEFNLPLYSWYPGPIKRHCERMAITTRPDWVAFARYPAVHWFTFGELRRYLTPLGVDCLGRLDVFDLAGRPPALAAVVRTARRLPPLRWAIDVMTEGTIVLGIKRVAH